MRSTMGRIDAVFFTFSALSATWLAFLLLRDGVRPGWPWLLLLVFWVFVSYLLLPRLHRILTRLYIPGYFIGRARTSDGLLGDPVNLALLGSEAQVHHALRAGGLDPRGRHRPRLDPPDHHLDAATAELSAGAGQPTAPLRPAPGLRLPAGGGRQPVQATPRPLLALPRRLDAARRPCRRLAGGRHLSTARSGLSLFTLQVTHKIEENTDVERDFVVSTVVAADPVVDVEVIRNFSTGYHTRNGGGDLIETDGDLPILDLRQVDAPTEGRRDADRQSQTDVRRRPCSASGVTLLRALVYLVLAVVVAVSADAFASLALKVDVKVSEDAGCDARAHGRGGAPRRGAGGRDPRLVRAVRSELGADLVDERLRVHARQCAFVANVRGVESITLSHLPTVGISVLVLLALSSHRARDYATGQRDEQPPR